MWLIALRDLQHRRRQVIVAILGSSLVFAMALVITGLGGGFRAEARKTVGAIGADGLVVKAQSGGPFTSFSGIPEATVAEVAALPGVTRADPILAANQPLVVGGGHPKVDTHLIGFRPHGLGAPHVIHGKVPDAAGEATADVRAKLALGSTVVAGGRQLTIVGITRGLTYDAGIPNVYATVADAQPVLFGDAKAVNAVAITGHPSSLPPGLAFMSNRDVQQDILRRLSNALPAVDNSRTFLWVVAAVIIGTVTYLSALERLRDFAVIKAVGGSSRQIYYGLAVQAVIVAVCAAGLAVLIEKLLANIIPMPTEVPTSSLLLLPAVAVGVGLLASLSGIQQAIRVDPALAFGG